MLINNSSLRISYISLCSSDYTMQYKNFDASVELYSTKSLIQNLQIIEHLGEVLTIGASHGNWESSPSQQILKPDWQYVQTLTPIHQKIFILHIVHYFLTQWV